MWSCGRGCSDTETAKLFHLGRDLSRCVLKRGAKATYNICWGSVCFESNFDGLAQATSGELRHIGWLSGPNVSVMFYK